MRMFLRLNRLKHSNSNQKSYRMEKLLSENPFLEESRLNLLSNLKNKIDFVFFSALWFWIVFVSSYDAYLTVRLRHVIQDSEENPIARYIMSLDDWDVSMFIGIKMFGTSLALWILIWLYVVNKKYGITVAVAIAFFQGCLMYYFLYDHLLGSFSLSGF